SYLPPEAVCSDNENRIQQWADEAVHFLQKYQKADIAIDPESVKNASFNAVKLRKLTAAVVKKITWRVKIEEFLIEGGSTASAVLNEIGIKKLVPVQELAPGIIRSETENHIHITLKPGSYNWPQEAWMF